MIFDEAERIIRYVELDASGQPMHECFSARFGGGDEEERWAALVESAGRKGRTLVRLCNHEHDCCNPDLNDIEGDGKGGFRFKAGTPADRKQGVERWKPEMERKFVKARDESYEEEKVYRVVRMEPGEWAQEQIDDGDFYITKEGVFDWRPKVPVVEPVVDTQLAEDAVEAAEALLTSIAEATEPEGPPPPAYAPPHEGSSYR